MSYSCAVKKPAAPGKSDIGSTPFLQGARSWISHLESVAGSHLTFLGPVLRGAVNVVVFPFGLFASATGFVGVGLAFALVPLYPVGALVHDVLPRTSPELVAAFVLLVLIRLVCLPLALRGSRSGARMDAIQPEIQRLKKKFGTDRQGFSQAVMALQKRVGVNPLSCLPPVVLTVLLVSGFYSLLHGLTIRSMDGTYSPAHIPTGSGLYQDLHATARITSWGMDLALAVPQVGVCSSLIPYLIALAAFLAVQWPLTREVRKRKTAYGLTITSFSLLAALTLPIFFVVLRVGDGLFVLLQNRLTKNARIHEFDKLTHDPEFLTSLTELATDFFPEPGGHPGPDAGPHGGRGHYTNPDDLNPHK